MAIRYREDITKKDFPIETDFCILVYDIVFKCMFDIGGPNRKSGLYGTRSFYSPEPDKVLPVVFGTIYNGRDYAEVLFSKAQKDELGKLEILLFGRNKKRLTQIQHSIKTKIQKELNFRKNRNG